MAFHRYRWSWHFVLFPSLQGVHCKPNERELRALFIPVAVWRQVVIACFSQLWLIWIESVKSWHEQNLSMVSFGHLYLWFFQLSVVVERLYCLIGWCFIGIYVNVLPMIVTCYQICAIRYYATSSVIHNNSIVFTQQPVNQLYKSKFIFHHL